MNKILAATLGMAGLMAMSATAYAVPVQTTWDFTVAPDTNDGSTATWTVGGKTISATAYSNLNINSSSLLPATIVGLTLASSGIGVNNSTPDNTGQLDNGGFFGGHFDFIVLELPTDQWEAVSMDFGRFGGDDDYDIWASNTLFSGLTQLANHEDDDPIAFAPGNLFQFLYVSGSANRAGGFFGGLCNLFSPGCVSNDDEFRIANFTGQVDSVPEPASLALLGLGLAGMGAVRRRRKVA